MVLLPRRLGLRAARVLELALGVLGAKALGGEAFRERGLRARFQLAQQARALVGQSMLRLVQGAAREIELALGVLGAQALGGEAPSAARGRPREVSASRA